MSHFAQAPSHLGRRLNAHECPLYRPEDGQHPQQDLLAVDGRPLANAMKIKEHKNKEMNYTN